MQKKSFHQRWFTCTPVDFSGGPEFFTRDSGLLCRSFQTLGMDSLAVMAGPARKNDGPDLIRAKLLHLTSSDWWKQHQLDGVVLYAWGMPKFLPIAHAIHRAGIKLVLNQDSVGIVSPLNGIPDWVAERNARLGPCPQGFKYFPRAIRIALEGLYQLAVVDPFRLLHLLQGDVVACVSPGAVERFRRYCRGLAPFGLPGRVHLVPHPVNPIFHYDGSTSKTPRIVAIGRWDDHLQKRPDVMMHIAERLLTKEQSVEIDIVGNVTPQLANWHQGLERAIAARIHLTGRLEPEDLAQQMRAAQIIYCSSAHESFHIASGEGLCSGCSVVSSKAPSLASFDWFTSRNSGTLAEKNSPEDHLVALELELRNWREGLRNPDSISQYWIKHLHGPNVARQILRLFSDLPISDTNEPLGF
ncbi:MAG: glycosyltransferase [Luteolibacter sp.]